MVKPDIDTVVCLFVLFVGGNALTGLMVRDHTLANLEIECPEKPLVKAVIEAGRVMCWYADIPARKDRVVKKPAVTRRIATHEGGTP